MTLSLLTLVLTVDPTACALPPGVSLRELTEQVLPISNAASAPGTSAKLSKLIARARALNKRQDPEQIAATLSERMAVLEDFLTLCSGEAQQLVVAGTMLNLTITAGELGAWEPTRARLVAAARRVSSAHPRSARAHLILAAALQLVQRSAPAAADRELALTELEAELAKCRALDAQLNCALSR